jgi:hypothetical protein
MDGAERQDGRPALVNWNVGFSNEWKPCQALSMGFVPRHNLRAQSEESHESMCHEALIASKAPRRFPVWSHRPAMKIMEKVTP